MNVTIADGEKNYRRTRGKWADRNGKKKKKSKSTKKEKGGEIGEGVKNEKNKERL